MLALVLQVEVLDFVIFKRNLQSFLQKFTIFIVFRECWFLILIEGSHCCAEFSSCF